MLNVITFDNTWMYVMDKHAIIYQNLLRKIANEEIKENERIPTEAELCREYSVSRITAMRAVKDLQAAGLVKRISGRGTFVCRNQQRTTLPFYLLIPFAKVHYYSRMAYEFQRFFAKLDIPCFICHTEYNISFTTTILHSIKNTGARGLAFVPSSDHNKDTILLKELQYLNIPLIAASRKLSGFTGTQVIVNEIKAGQLAAEYLLNKKYKRILYAGPTTGERFLGVQKAFEVANVSSSNITILKRIDSVALPTLKIIFSMKNPPQAIIAGDDNFAIRVYDQLSSLGFPVGNEIALVGLDGGLLGLSLESPLTTLEFPGGLIGQQIAEKLYECNQNGNKNTEQTIITIPPKLIVRASCGDTKKIYRHEYLRELIKENH